MMTVQAERRTTLTLHTTDDGVEHTESTFCLETELRQISDETYNDYYRLLESAAVDSNGQFPLYRFVSWQFLYPPRHPMALVYLLPLAERLHERIEVGGYERIECRDVDEQYWPVVEDVADQTGVKITCQQANGDDYHGRSRCSLLRSLLGAVLLFLDEIFSWLYSRFDSVSTAADTLVVPSIDRFESTEPVFKKLHDAKLVLPAGTTTWVRSRKQYLSLYRQNAVPVGRYVSLRTIGRQLLTWASFGWEILLKRSLDRELVAVIERQKDLNCPRTVRAALDKVYETPLFISTLQTYAFESAFERTQCRRVVTSVGSGSTSQGIWLAAQRCEIDAYYLPHSISLSYTKRNAPGVSKFVPGKLGMRVHDERLQRGLADEFVPLGRPYLTELYADREQYKTPITEDAPVRIVIGTEPLDDKVRTTFVESVLDAIERMALDAEVTLKIHPDEQPSFYERLRDNRSDEFEILEDQLYECLGEADLVVTMASNIGLEAIVLGTPNACVTFDRPFVRPLPYAAEGPVPTFDAEREVLRFFEELTREQLKSMRNEQRAFLRENYVLDANAAEDIAQYIESN
jgi:hypothetical protein